MQNLTDETVRVATTPGAQPTPSSNPRDSRKSRRIRVATRGQRASERAGGVFRARSDASRRIARWEWPALVAILIAASALNCIGLAAEGYGNGYYAATVRSMMSSWHAF